MGVIDTKRKKEALCEWRKEEVCHTIYLFQTWRQTDFKGNYSVLLIRAQVGALGCKSLASKRLGCFSLYVYVKVQRIPLKWDHLVFLESCRLARLWLGLIPTILFQLREPGWNSEMLFIYLFFISSYSFLLDSELWWGESLTSYHIESGRSEFRNHCTSLKVF